MTKNYPEYLQDQKPHATQIVSEIIKHGGVIFAEYVRHDEWCALVEAVDDIDSGGPYEVMTWKPMPPTWPKIRNPLCRHVVHDTWLPRQIPALQKAQINHRHYDHGAGVTKDFYVPYGTENHDRERVMRAMESLNLLTNSHYSRPAVSRTRDQLPVYAEQPTNQPILPRTMEAEDSGITMSQRFDHGTNWHSVRPYMISCQVAVVLDNYCFNDGYSGYIGEKSLYPIAAGIPWIYAGNINQRRRLLERGFRPHMPMAETPERLIDQMLWLKAVFTNPEMTKNWQASQGMTVIHNQRVLADLHRCLESESTL